MGPDSDGDNRAGVQGPRAVVTARQSFNLVALGNWDCPPASGDEKATSAAWKRYAGVEGRRGAQQAERDLPALP